MTTSRRRGVLRTAVFAAALSCLAGPILVAQNPASGAGAQAPPAATEGTGAISGVVLDATTNQPVSGVLVYLGLQGRGAVGRLSRQVTDDKGRFVFSDLPAASNYFINATKPGYVEGHLGVGAGGQLGGTVALTDGQWYADANVLMQRLGGISGTVLDEHGDPAVGVFVRVLAKIRVAGQLRLAAGQVTKTDDRGFYRIPDLMPGRYVVQVPIVQQSVSSTMTAADISGIPPDQVAEGRIIAVPPPLLDISAANRLVVGGYLTPPSPVGGQPLAYPPVFYPGVPQLSAASTIELRVGEERGNTDLSLRPAPALSISGVVDGPADVLAGMVVRLMPEGLEDLGTGSEVATAALGADGRFALFNVPAGTYLLDARRTLAELQYRTVLATPSQPLPRTAGAAGGSSGGGTILSGPSGATYNTQTSRGNGAYFAQMKVTLDARPITDLVVPLHRGVTIRGKFVDESGAPMVFPSGLGSTVYAEPADGNLGLGMPSGTKPTQNTFEIQGLLGGPYLLRLFANTGSVISIVADGEDHRVKPFDGSAGHDYDVVITLSEKRTDLSGTATDAGGQSVKGAIVIVFPVEREQWTNYGLSPLRLKGSPTTSAGGYHFQSLPDGEYFVVGVPPEQSDAWQDPAKLAVLAASAARVKLAWGDKKTLDVKVVRLQ